MSLNKKKKAVALTYNPDESYAPTIIAKGKGIVADNIIDHAKEVDVPIYENEKLANQLINIEIGQEIPRELYQVVAEILVFVNDLDKLEGKLNGYKQKKNW